MRERTSTDLRLVRRLLLQLYPAASAGDEAATRGETRAFLVSALTFAAVLVVVGIATFGVDVPLWELVSVGTISALAGGLSAGAGAVLGQLTTPDGDRASWRRGLPIAQRVVDFTSVALVHVLLAAMVSVILFYTLQHAFEGLSVDTLTTAMMAATLSALYANISFHISSNLTTSRLAGALATLVTTGVMLSMTTSQDPTWWQFHFSELGTGTGFSGASFNITLIAGGIVLAGLANYIAADLSRWDALTSSSRPRHVRLFRAGFVTVGIGLSGVGLVPVNESLVLHNTFATGMAVVFGGILIALRWLLPGLPRTAYILSDVVVVAIVVAALFWWPIGYYNLTAVELIAAGLIFGWLVLFIRAIGALAETRAASHARATVAAAPVAAVGQAARVARAVADDAFRPSAPGPRTDAMDADDVPAPAEPGAAARIHVVAGAIADDSGLVLAVRRAPGTSQAGRWEFPGGKVEAREDARAALARELREELGVEVLIGERVDRSVTRVGSLDIDLECFSARLAGARPTSSTDHDAFAWMPAASLPALDWCPPDEPAMARLAAGSGATDAEGASGARATGEPVIAPTGEAAPSASSTKPRITGR